MFTFCLYCCLCLYSCICGSAYTFVTVFLGLCVSVCVPLSVHVPVGPPLPQASLGSSLSFLLPPQLCHPGWDLWAQGALALKLDLEAMLHFLWGM